MEESTMLVNQDNFRYKRRNLVTGILLILMMILLFIAIIVSIVYKCE